MRRHAEEFEAYRRSHDFNIPPSDFYERQAQELGVTGEEFEAVVLELRQALTDSENIEFVPTSRLGPIVLDTEEIAPGEVQAFMRHDENESLIVRLRLASELERSGLKFELLPIMVGHRMRPSAEWLEVVPPRVGDCLDVVGDAVPRLFKLRSERGLFMNEPGRLRLAALLPPNFAFEGL